MPAGEGGDFAEVGGRCGSCAVRGGISEGDCGGKKRSGAEGEEGRRYGEGG